MKILSKGLGVGGVKHSKGAWNHGGHHGSVLNVTFSTVFKIYLPTGSGNFCIYKDGKKFKRWLVFDIVDAQETKTLLNLA